LLGDAELDEGNVWEAVMEPATRKLGNVLWIVDLNRQSLDRVIPVIKAVELEREFETAGWQVLELKYGRRLRGAFAREGGELPRSKGEDRPRTARQGASRRGAGNALGARPVGDVEPGCAREAAPLPLARAGPGGTRRDDLPRRQRLDEPRRLDQQDGRLGDRA